MTAPVWSESSLCAQWVAEDPIFLHADSEDWSDRVDAKADLSLRWTHMPFYCFGHEVAQICFSALTEYLQDMIDLLTRSHSQKRWSGWWLSLIPSVGLPSPKTPYSCLSQHAGARTLFHSPVLTWTKKENPCLGWLTGRYLRSSTEQITGQKLQL